MSDRMNRSAVYRVIDGERKYQDQKWGGPTHDQQHSIPEWLIYMRDYIEEAMHACSRLPDEEAMPLALDNIRKVTAMGVACMEIHGAPERK